MRFTCDGCGKRYATADEPVPGRVYKLTCKRCGHVIVLRVPAAVVGPAASAPGVAPTAAAANAVPAQPAPTAPAATASPTAAPPRAPALQAAPPAPPVGGLDGALGAAPTAEEEAPERAPVVERTARTPPPVPSTAATPSDAAPAAPSPDLELPLLLPEEGEEVAPTAAAGPASEPAGPSAPGARRRFELSRMSRPRAGLPLPVVLVALLIMVAIVVALIRVDRPRPSQAPPEHPTAAAPAR